MVTRIGASKTRKLFIAEWREKRDGMTQQVLADRMGTTKGTISRWETGERDPTLAAVYGLAEALRIDVEQLFHHPDRPSRDELLRGATPEEISQALTVVRALKRA